MEKETLRERELKLIEFTRNSSIGYGIVEILKQFNEKYPEKQVETHLSPVSDEEIKDGILEILDGNKKGSWYFECEHGQGDACTKSCGGYCQEFAGIVNQLKDLFRDLMGNKGGGWISVEERLPEYAKDVMVFDEIYFNPPIQAYIDTTGKWYGSRELRESVKGYCDDWEIELSGYISCWRELPPPPEK